LPTMLIPCHCWAMRIAYFGLHHPALKEGMKEKDASTARFLPRADVHAKRELYHPLTGHEEENCIARPIIGIEHVHRLMFHTSEWF